MTITRKQREALYRVFLRKYPYAGELRPLDQFGLYRQFRRGAISAIGGDCIMIQTAGIWLGIERDGYTHS